MSKKYLFLGLLIVSFLIAPLSTRALTTAEQIAQLQRQILMLQTQLRELQSQQPNLWCHTFNVSFGVGANNQEAGFLIQALVKEGLLNYNQTTYFSESVASAVSSFQLKYKSEILTPLGLTTPTGYVGPSTRRVLNRLYGCGVLRPIPGNRPPSISGVDGPTTLNINQTGTWSVRASDPENGQLSYSVIWGDEPDLAYGTVASPSAAPVQQTATFTHTYSRAGTYYPKFKVTDNTGQSNSASLSVVVGQNQSSPITVTSPNGGGQWAANSVKPITWRYDGATSATKVDLYLQAPMPVCPLGMACAQFMPRPITLDQNIPALATYNWIVATDIVNNPIVPGSYKVYVCPVGSGSPYSNNCDSSDNYFSILGSVTR